MKEKASFTTEKPIDYTQTKDAYEGNRESACYKDAPLPPEKKPGKKKDLIPDEVPRRDGPGRE